jgi:hypothetical protein
MLMPLYVAVEVPTLVEFWLITVITRHDVPGAVVCVQEIVSKLLDMPPLEELMKYGFPDPAPNPTNWLTLSIMRPSLRRLCTGP